MGADDLTHRPKHFHRIFRIMKIDIGRCRVPNFLHLFKRVRTTQKIIQNLAERKRIGGRYPGKPSKGKLLDALNIQEGILIEAITKISEYRRDRGLRYFICHAT